MNKEKNALYAWKQVLGHVETRKAKPKKFYTIVLMLGGLGLLYLLTPYIKTLTYALVFWFRWNFGV